MRQSNGIGIFKIALIGTLIKPSEALSLCLISLENMKRKGKESHAYLRSDRILEQLDQGKRDRGGCLRCFHR